MKQLSLLLIILSLFYTSSIDQRDSFFPLTISIKLLKSYVQKQNQYDIAVTLQNNGAKPVFIWLMKCSYSDNFEVNNDNYNIKMIQCYMNYPELLKIEPNGSRVYTLTLSKSIEYHDPWGKTTKLGLILIDDMYNPKPSGLDKYGAAMADISPWKIIWSNPLTL